MRKIGVLLLLLLLTFSLVGCGENGEAPGAAVVDDEKPFEGTVLELSVAYGGAEGSFDQFTAETGIEIEWISMSTGAKLSQLQAKKGIKDNG